MKILLAFLPFIVFAIASTLGYSTLGLIGGSLTAACFLIRDLSGASHRLKLLDAGTFVLFGALAIIVWISGATMSIAMVRTCVDSGLLLLILITIAMGRPFTIDYAKEQVAPELWSSPRFLRTNRIISLAWAAAFAAIIAADVAMLHNLVPTRTIAFIIIGSLYGAYRFTLWYPRSLRNAADPN
ncbi:hypothetical protein FHW69_002866 [Luteibacter sp. Sphag1AF]|uniref:hypothetical protein n=1 Tax=Luteibacter sp. Sphag1AF TaxID=2587031 RepID=UPI00161A1BC1|nr:hypothetical protein [Luteibacter sp. Sphag1AF]MBB3228231.1 hypothetical protein [Luteibacter sp. Sphag1AF]